MTVVVTDSAVSCWADKYICSFLCSPRGDALTTPAVPPFHPSPLRNMTPTVSNSHFPKPGSDVLSNGRYGFVVRIILALSNNWVNWRVDDRGAGCKETRIPLSQSWRSMWLRKRCVCTYIYMRDYGTNNRLRVIFLVYIYACRALDIICGVHASRDHGRGNGNACEEGARRNWAPPCALPPSSCRRRTVIALFWIKLLHVIKIYGLCITKTIACMLWSCSVIRLCFNACCHPIYSTPSVLGSCSDVGIYLVKNKQSNGVTSNKQKMLSDRMARYDLEL